MKQSIRHRIKNKKEERKKEKGRNEKRTSVTV
jgi:hypothetical protein